MSNVISGMFKQLHVMCSIGDECETPLIDCSDCIHYEHYRKLGCDEDE